MWVDVSVFAAVVGNSSFPLSLFLSCTHTHVHKCTHTPSPAAIQMQMPADSFWCETSAADCLYIHFSWHWSHFHIIMLLIWSVCSCGLQHLLWMTLFFLCAFNCHLPSSVVESSEAQPDEVAVISSSLHLRPENKKKKKEMKKAYWLVYFLYDSDVQKTNDSIPNTIVWPC